MPIIDETMEVFRARMADLESMISQREEANRVLEAATKTLDELSVAITDMRTQVNDARARLKSLI